MSVDRERLCEKISRVLEGKDVGEYKHVVICVICVIYVIGDLCDLVICVICVIGDLCNLCDR